MKCIFCKAEIKLDNPYINGFHTGHLIYSTGVCINCPMTVSYAWDFNIPNISSKFRYAAISSKLSCYNGFVIILNYLDNKTEINKASDKNGRDKTIASLPYILDVTPDNFNDYVKRFENMIAFS